MINDWEVRITVVGNSQVFAMVTGSDLDQCIVQAKQMVEESVEKVRPVRQEQDVKMRS